ncbi:hypothetical protein PSPO01_16157, partial [Paraphaeosphaeria sporulosa]
MSRPSTRGTGDASSPREVRPTDDRERPKRPTRNAPRILHSGTILYSNNFRALSQAREQDDGELEDMQGTAREAPQTPTSTIHNSPQRKTRKTKTMRLQTLTSAAAPIASQLRQGRIDQTKGLQEAVDKIMAAMKEQEELADERHRELQAELQGFRAQNEQLKQELHECKQEIKACKDALALAQGATNRPTYAAALTSTRESPQPSQPIPSNTNGPSDTLASLPGFDLDMTEAYGMHMEDASVKRIRERIQQAFKSHGPTQDIGWVGIARR